MDIRKILFIFVLANAMNSTSSMAADSGQFFGVPEKFIDKAQSLPCQHSLGKEGSWSCGPNSLIRFLLLHGIKPSCDQKEYEVLVKNCPRSCGQPTTKIGYGACAAFALASSTSFYWADGYADIACALVSGACALAPFAIEFLNQRRGFGKVGPTPRWLSGYGNSLLGKGQEIKVGYFHDENQLIDRIKQELRDGRPVIVLIKFAPLAWHYINIISYKDDGFIYLDTDSSQGHYSRNDLISLMDFENNSNLRAIKSLLSHVGWYLGVDIGRFNLLYLENAKDVDDRLR